MIAFVLSGGGNRGASQAGALLALLERGIVPDLLVGASVGSLNAVAMACDPSLAGAQQAVEIWRRVRCENIFPGNPLTVGWRVVTNRGSLHDRKNFVRFLRTTLPQGVETFGDLRARCLVVATVLGTSRMRLFGGDQDEAVIDALLASTAIPPFFAPYRYRDEWLVDGAVLSNLPLELAISYGARTVYALEIADDEATADGRSLTQNLAYSLSAMFTRQSEMEQRLTRLTRRGLAIHTIRLTAGQHLAYNDFRRSAELIDASYQATHDYLSVAAVTADTPFRRFVRAARTALQMTGAPQKFIAAARAPAVPHPPLEEGPAVSS
jgi:NTE family protein